MCRAASSAWPCGPSPATEHVIGDADEGFSVQSITKVFALGLALNRFGDEVWTRVGKEPSGTPFNHLSQLESEAGRAAQPVHQRRGPGDHRPS
jgi:glutaminase